MTATGFAVSSSVPSLVLTSEIGTALLECLRRTELLWAPWLTSETMPDIEAHDVTMMLLENASRWGNAPHVGLEYTTTLGQVSDSPSACRVEFVENWDAFPGTPANFEAFHTIDAQNRQVCCINVTACGSAAEAIVAASHEISECRINPSGRLSFPRGDGTRWAGEVCDSLEGSNYVEPGGTIPVANVAGPRYFGLTTEGPLDIAGAVSESWQQLSTGYHAGTRSNGEQYQEFGAEVSEARRARITAVGPRGMYLR